MTADAAESLRRLGEALRGCDLERLTDDAWVPTQEDIETGRQIVADVLEEGGTGALGSH